MPIGLSRLTKVGVLIAATAGSMLALSPESATADSRRCSQIEMELAAAGNGPSAATRIQKYESAMDRQRDELGKVRKRTRQAGCGYALFDGSASECGVLNATIERMERNLEALRRKRDEFSRGGSAGVQARIIASLEANRCRENASGTGDRNADFIGRVLGNGTRNGLPSGNGGDAGNDPHVRRLADPIAGAGGRSVVVRIPSPPREFRTLCVRICDGYFFPMSAQASPLDFGGDQKRCEASCPGAEVRVYHHRLVGEGPADMVTASGSPYSELPTANLYLKSGVRRPASCGCNAPASFEIIAGQPRQSEPPLTPSVSEAAPAAKPIPEHGPAQKVRVVGPAFLPGPEEAIDLQAPDRTPAR